MAPQRKKRGALSKRASGRLRTGTIQTVDKPTSSQKSQKRKKTQYTSEDEFEDNMDTKIVKAYVGKNSRIKSPLPEKDSLGSVPNSNAAPLPDLDFSFDDTDGLPVMHHHNLQPEVVLSSDSSGNEPMENSRMKSPLPEKDSLGSVPYSNAAPLPDIDFVFDNIDDLPVMHHYHLQPIILSSDSSDSEPMEVLPKKNAFSDLTRTHKLFTAAQRKDMTKVLANTKVEEKSVVNVVFNEAAHNAYCMEIMEEISVILRWPDDNSKFLKMMIRKHQPFKAVFNKVAEKENKDPSQVILTVTGDQIILPNDTPFTRGFHSMQIFFVSFKEEVHDDQAFQQRALKLKVQCEWKRKPKTVMIEKEDVMGVLMEKFAEMEGLDAATLTFMFDGDVIDADDTVESLDLEGGEVIDVVKKK